MTTFDSGFGTGKLNSYGFKINVPKKELENRGPQEQEDENILGEYNTPGQNNSNEGLKLTLNEANWVAGQNLINIDKVLIVNNGQRTDKTVKHPQTNPKDDKSEKTQEELLQILLEWGKEVDNTSRKTGLFDNNIITKDNPFADSDDSYSERVAQIITKQELLGNIAEMTQSGNPEIAGIGGVLKAVFDALGMDLPEDIDYNSFINSVSSDNNSSQYRSIVVNEIYNAIFNALYPEDNSNPYFKATSTSELTGLHVEDLVKLDKNGDGSIVDELKDLLNSPEFIQNCQYKINTTRMENEISQLDADMDGKISESELIKLKLEGYNNSILDLLFMQESNKFDALDTTLLFLIGAEYDEQNQEYVITPEALFNALIKLDKNGDGKVTQEEVEQFRQENKEHYEAKNIKKTEINNSNQSSYMDKLNEFKSSN